MLTASQVSILFRVILYAELFFHEDARANNTQFALLCQKLLPYNDQVSSCIIGSFCHLDTFKLTSHLEVMRSQVNNCMDDEVE